jgi:hypothetical protein
VDGVDGWLKAQLGVPRIVLLDRVIDRFELEVNARAQFFAEAGSAYLPRYMHGLVKATYKIEPIDPNCPGWHTRAADYFWPRVIRSTVRFSGTTSDDRAALSPDIDEAQVNARIERLLAELLDNRFEAAPHPVGRRFRPGRMLSLNSGGRDAVALPISPGGGDPAGRVSSITQNFLAGSDFAVALNADWLMGQIQPYIDQIRAPTEPIPVEAPPMDAIGFLTHPADVTYLLATRITAANVEWEVGGPFFLGSRGLDSHNCKG